MKQVAGMYLVGGITLVSEIALPELPLIQHKALLRIPLLSGLGDGGEPVAGRHRGGSRTASRPPRNISCVLQESHATWLPRDGRSS